MATRVVDEREHRRGLVLGLTLAEVLLLLLFLVMLALSIPLMTHDEAGKPPESPITLRDEVERLRRMVDQLTGGRPPSEVQQKLKTLADLEKELAGSKLTIAQLKDQVSVLKSHLGSSSDLEALKTLLQEATRINPDDPPTSLRQASALLKAINSLKPTDANRLSPTLQDELVGALNRAKEINPLDPVTALKKRLEIDEVALSNAQSRGKHDWPPIITLSEADGCFFKTGSAEIDDCLRAKLRDTVPLLVQRARDYDVDVIEVIGHTDEQPIVQRPSNLDFSLLSVVKGTGFVSTLIPADNAGLGIARAVAVVRALLNDPNMGPYRILPLSGGQLIGTDERLTKGVQGDIKERRRIEIRLRRSQPAAPRSVSLGTTGR
jgi:flagellar motor protein MotB